MSDLTMFLLIVIVALTGLCMALGMAIGDYKIDLKDTNDLHERALVVLQSHYNKSAKRAQLLKDISEALYYGPDLKDKEILYFYERLWEMIQEDIAKELKAKS